MVARLGRLLNSCSRRLMPEPFVLAVLLSAVVGLAAALRLCLTADSVWRPLAKGWFTGFTSTPLLAFALQMCLVLVTGHALAVSPIMQRFVRWISKLPNSTGSAALLVSFVSCVSAVVHWGLGAIVGAFLAREIARYAAARKIRLHYPLLGGAAYAGLCVWHGGLSGSAPLKVAEAGHFAEEVAGVIPVTQTLLSPLNLLTTGFLVLTIPLCFWFMTPKDEAEFHQPEFDEEALQGNATPAHLNFVSSLGHSVWLGRIVGAGGVMAMGWALLSGGVSLNLNVVNCVFLFAGIATQGALVRYASAVADGARSAGAILLQFPFYFGVLGMMKAATLIEWIGDGFVSIATERTFPILTFLAAGIVNLFVPSGGGQWAVQGEALLAAGARLGVDPATTIMAFSYGDAWTNMLQPFWALPLLGIMGLSAKEIIGYTGVVWLWMGASVTAILFFFG